MFIIDNINIGRFGNKLLYYNNLVQVSHFFNQNYFCHRFENDDIFKFSEFQNNIKNYDYSINHKFLIENKNYKFNNDIIMIEPCLGDLFYEFDSLDTHKIFEFKNPIIYDKNVVTVGVHYRGTDFYNWDPKSILKTEYYLSAIDSVIQSCKNVIFKLFTDDTKLESYLNTIQFLKSNNLPFKLGNPNDLREDFINLSYSDYIISSPSTYSISAGFCGKPNKKIIHSKEWVNYQCEKKDKFWIGFDNGGNRNYKKYQLL